MADVIARTGTEIRRVRPKKMAILSRMPTTEMITLIKVEV